MINETVKSKFKLSEIILGQIEKSGVKVEWDPRNKEYKFESLVINIMEFSILVIYSKEISKGKCKPNTYSEDNQSEFQIKQEFDITKFNFNTCNCKCQAVFEVAADDYILINVYPVIQNSLLLLPKMKFNKPQIIDSPELLYTSVLLTKDNSAVFNNDQIIIGYNSKGACSSINHLHFQIFFFHSIDYEPWLSYRKNSSIYIEGLKRLKLSLTKSDNTTDEVDDCSTSSSYSFIELKSENYQNCKVYIAKLAISENEDIAFLIVDHSNVTDSSQQLYDLLPISPESFSSEVKSISAVIFALIQRLNSKNTPYNIIFQKGHAIIIPRRPDKVCEDIFFGILEFMHIYSCYSETEFLEFNSNTYFKGLKIYLYSSVLLQELVTG